MARVYNANLSLTSRPMPLDLKVGYLIDGRNTNEHNLNNFYGNEHGDGTLNASNIQHVMQQLDQAEGDRRSRL